MEIAIRVLILFASLFFIIKGGDFFVESSVDIAKRTKIPQIIIGATVVSFATTLPELLISILDSIDGSTELAVGNAVGSCICNIGLVCGIAFAILPTDVPKGSNLKFWFLLLAAIAFVVLGFFGQLQIWQAIVLMALVFAFFVCNYIDAKKSEYEPEVQQEQLARPIWLSILFFIIGAMGVAGGAWLLIRQVTFLAEVAGISEQFIGLTVVAVGTSLPELTTMLICIRKKQTHIGIGNIVGANILNLTLILGTSRLTAFGQTMYINNQTAFVTLPLMLLLTALLLLPLLIKNKTFRWQGITLLTLYILYITFLIVNIFIPLF